jgi:hypothetical protein
MSVTSESVSISIEDILTSLKSFETPELFKFLKTALAEAEKKSKTTAKATKATTKKQGSMPKGTVPPQLRKPRAWVEFTLKDALENGWESFTITQKKKSGEVEEIEMPASTLHEGAHVYEDSITEKTPNGKQIIHKEAMSLSKHRKETGHPTYQEFETQYAEEIASEETSDDAESTTSSKKSKASTVVKKTAAEKQAEMEAKKAVKEAEKEAKKAEKEAEKEAKKAEKEAEKEAKKAQALAEKEAKKLAKEQEKEQAKKPVVPAKAVKETPTPVKVVKSEESTPTPTPAPVKITKSAPKPTPKKEEVIPDDGMVHPWTFEGKKYLRNHDGETWSVGSDGGIGKWVGIYSSQTNKIDTSVPEPEFDDEE